jgi:hypothetical protein
MLLNFHAIADFVRVLFVVRLVALTKTNVLLVHRVTRIANDLDNNGLVALVAFDQPTCGETRAVLSALRIAQRPRRSLS